ncbi:Major facilitator superfamily domain, general substrate transporter [Moelleriella libera RCEF 2490]|uniref:Major facilitator superfamily domain, general substrate transporter n=1 Tax=Moelleriella libera RCEF 2490 TaxID=1081109 RepID=A0A166PKU3_9HYPO|nr:Major facilitator superfamily domain, general substrate transporter [Moelleriella libera RCEF 2490]
MASGKQANTEIDCRPQTDQSESKHESSASTSPGATTEASSPSTEYASGWKLGAIVLALLLIVFMFALDMTIVATAIPKITNDFHSLDDVSWYGSVFFMTCAGFLAAWGKASKYFPLKWVFLFSVLVFEVGSLICGAAPTSTALIVGRATAGVGCVSLQQNPPPPPPPPPDPLYPARTVLLAGQNS